MKLFKKEDWEFEVASGYNGYRNKISGRWIYAEEYDKSVLVTGIIVDIVSRRGVSSALVDIKCWLDNPTYNFDSELYKIVLKTIESKD
jgi:hypothetical protein